MNTNALEILIWQTWKDLKKLNEAWNYLNKKASYSATLTDESTDDQILGIPDIDMPEWIKDVNVDIG